MKHEFVAIGRPSVLRHTNALSILALLREAGSCSRADLVRASGLSAPTVTNVVKDLLSAGLVAPLGEGKSSGGRPPDMIRFRAERGCVLAVEITARALSFLLADLNGDEIDAHTFSLAKQKTTPKAICGYISDCVKVILRRQKMKREQLLVMVVGVPAITNVDEGIVLSISTLESWRSVPLRAMLSEANECLVIVENDMNLAAQGELYRGAAKGERDFVYISIGANVGAGIIVNGRTHYGSQWSAGEIGYLRLPNISRKNPTLHEFGELESVLNSNGIVASWHEITNKMGDKSNGRAAADVTRILALAESGNAKAEKLVQHRAGIVADVVINLSLILNPGLILLSGEVGSHPAILRSVRKQLEGSEFAVPRVAAGALAGSALLWGGIAVALEEVPAVLVPQPSI